MDSAGELLLQPLQGIIQNGVEPAGVHILPAVVHVWVVDITEVFAVIGNQGIYDLDGERHWNASVLTAKYLQAENVDCFQEK